MFDVYFEQEVSRLDQFLVLQLGWTRQKVKRLIEQEIVRVNGRVEKVSFRLKKGMRIQADLDLFLGQASSRQVFMGDIPFLFEDLFLLVIHKPVGLLSHAVTDFDQRSSVVSYLQDHLVTLFDSGLSYRAGLVHRLDCYTEGLMVIAKQKQVYDHLVKQFQERVITKRYYAMVRGDFPHAFYVFDQPITRHSKQGNRFCVSSSGKESLTHVTVLKRFGTKTLLDVQLFTGRTHQIRVHLSHYGFPVLGDPLYDRKGAGQGQLLQAYSLGFFHPIMNKKMIFSLPLSDRLC